MTGNDFQLNVSAGKNIMPGTEAKGTMAEFTVVVRGDVPASLILYEKGTEHILTEVPLPVMPWLGDLRSIRIEGPKITDLEYNYRIDGRVVTDPAARLVVGRTPFGSRKKRTEHSIRGRLRSVEFHWEEDVSPRLAWPDVISCYLHVRGYTMGASSGVRRRGTFAGLKEKLGYLEKLGVNQLILMPAYEFEEMMYPERRAYPGRPEAPVLPDSAAGTADKRAAADPAAANSETDAAEKNHVSDPVRINYWGYTKSWYYAPKMAYSADGDPDLEVMDLVKSMHERGMELIMEFAFPEGMDPALAEDILSYWVREYHIDGFRLLADERIVFAASVSPRLRRVKIISTYFDFSPEYMKDQAGSFHLADFNDGFRNDSRHLLKGDENFLEAFAGRMRACSGQKGILNSITGHDGFTLMDLVSYDGKHNEENGEDNRDGAPTEFSWNCGCEGPSRKKTVRAMRLRQMKNALAMLMLAQGTPVLLAGDEHGNTQKGNNNPYCIDSPVTWLDWNRGAFAKSLTSFFQELAALRKKHALLRGETEGMVFEGVKSGYPRVSCHSSRAWYADYSHQCRHIGLMYCGREEGEEAFLYLAFNLHWEEQEFALPYLPEGMSWKCVLTTDEQTEESFERTLVLPGRTVMVLEGQSEK